VLFIAEGVDIFQDNETNRVR